MKKLVALAVLCAALTSCMSDPMNEVYQTSMTRDVYFMLPDGGVITGRIVTTGRSKFISFVRPDNVACSASYIWRNNYQISVPCSDRTSALFRVMPNTERREAELYLPDGRMARMSLDHPQQLASTTQDSSVSTGPSISNDYCRNSNYYGATSCVTGLPKTVHVSGYYRRDGTYVKPYWRSKR